MDNTEITPKIYFESYVQRAFEEYKEDVLDDYKARIACMFCFHMSDMMYEYYYKHNFEGQDRNKNMIYIHVDLGKKIDGWNIIQAVCNATKHIKDVEVHDMNPSVIVSAGSVQSQGGHWECQDGSLWETQGGKAWLTADAGVALVIDDKRYSIEKALEDAISFWKSEVGKYD